MQKDALEELRKKGVDVDTALRRFAGNTALYLKYVLCFPEDETMELLAAAVEVRDAEAALVAAHTLKGLAGNLEFAELSEAAAEMVTLFREEAAEEAFSRYGSVRGHYDNIISTILNCE